MAITDINISEELMTDAPSIKYRGEEGPKSPQQEQMMMVDSMLRDEYEQYVYDLLEQRPEATPMSFEEFRQMVIGEGMMGGGNPLPEDPTKPVNPFQPKPIGPLPDKREMAAYGGIMGADGRRQYGIGSFFQKYIKDPIEMAITGKTYKQLEEESQKRVDREPEGYESYFDTLFKGEKKEKDGKEYREGGIDKYVLPAIGGLTAGLFTKKNQDGSSGGQPTADETALMLADLKKSANILDQKQGMAAGLNFLPAVSARKFTPTEMIETYKTESAANGGRIGYDQGNIVNPFSELEIFQLKNLGYDVANKGVEPFGGVEVLKDILKVNQQRPYAMGGRIGRAEGGIMDLGGMEKDYRAEGGFVPIGREEKADDVPARLSVNEFVFTADAVRNAGGGDIDQGAKVMENMMKHLEAGGQVSEESQGMAGARDMFEVSERLSEVI
jgi:uncharacterized short protein YbdD (DUF466 family)